MRAARDITRHRFPELIFLCLCTLMVTVWFAGGASRADMLGQLVVRGMAWLMLAVAIMLGAFPSARSARIPLGFLMVCIALPCLQLIPLPPKLWLLLPGHAPFAEAASLARMPQPWRPIAIVPGAAINAAGSLIVPFSTLFLAAGVTRGQRAMLPGVVLALAASSALVGALQFCGAGLPNPLINYTPGEVSGTFANRNHFALLEAIGCVVAPAWAFMGDKQSRWRAPLAFALLPVFILLILASGSRAGMMLGAAALTTGVLLSHKWLNLKFRTHASWSSPALPIGIIGMVAIVVVASVLSHRANSIDRLLSLAPSDDLRARNLRTVWSIIWTYFPVGSGFGGFDPLFRLHEPFSALQLTYFNHAHNDFAEVVLDGGLPALLLIIAAVAWWASASLRLLRAPASRETLLPRLGATVLFLIFAASLFDYPVRTPMIMMITALAALWLGRGVPDTRGATLPSR